MLCNHKRENDFPGFLCMKLNATLCVFHCGQLLVDYISDPGKRHNGHLLMSYGFVVRGNPYDSVSIKVFTNFLPTYNWMTDNAHSLCNR